MVHQLDCYSAVLCISFLDEFRQSECLWVNNLWSEGRSRSWFWGPNPALYWIHWDSVTLCGYLAGFFLVALISPHGHLCQAFDYFSLTLITYTSLTLQCATKPQLPGSLATWLLAGFGQCGAASRRLEVSGLEKPWRPTIALPSLQLKATTGPLWFPSFDGMDLSSGVLALYLLSLVSSPGSIWGMVAASSCASPLVISLSLLNTLVLPPSL